MGRIDTHTFRLPWTGGGDEQPPGTSWRTRLAAALTGMRAAGWTPADVGPVGPLDGEVHVVEAGGAWVVIARWAAPVPGESSLAMHDRRLAWATREAALETLRSGHVPDLQQESYRESCPI